MLSIYIYSANPGFLDIPPTSQLDIEAYAAAFQDSEGASEFSLPMDLFWTDINRLRFGFAERLENYSQAANYWICDVYDDGFPEMVKAKITMISRKGNFAYRNGSFNISVSGTRGLFASTIKSKKLTDLSYGGTISTGNFDSREFAYWHHTTGYAQYPELRFCPLGFEKFYDQDRTDFNGEFLAKNTVNNIVLNGVGGWVFGRPDENNPTVAVPKNLPPYRDYQTVPFLTVKFVLKKVFEENGFNVTGEFFTNPDFENLVLFNNVGIERYLQNDFVLLGTSVDQNKYITYNQHVPEMLISDFLKAIFAGTGQFMNFIDDSNVELLFHNTNIATAQVEVMDDVLIDNFEATYPDGNAGKNGYKIAYTNDPDDQYYSERVKDLTTHNLLTKVNTMADLAAIPGGGLTTNDMVYVQAQNMYYTVADATVVPVLWDAYAEGLEEYRFGSGDKAVDIPYSTLAQYVILNETTALQENQGYLATRQKGTYTTRKFVRVKNSFALRVFYASAPGNAAIPPTSYNHNRDASNNITEKYSLALNTINSVTALLSPWQDILQNALVVTIELLGSTTTIERLKKFKKIILQGVVFFQKKTDRTIPLGPTVKVELVPL